MIAGTDPNASNHDVFWRLFGEHTNLDTAEIQRVSERFCEEEFSKLASLTQRRTIAATLVQACLDVPLKVVVATNPLFPMSLIKQRLAWAGVPVSKYNYDLVTAYENMHNTKPNSSYYSEILERIKCEPELAIMVGDSWENDIEPAASLGLSTCWLNEGDDEPPDTSLIIGRGSLDDFYDLFMNGQRRRFWKD
jgi:HAD superfamily hydrolase (TIGR01549 family)